jgi:hypothetical protein
LYNFLGEADGWYESKNQRMTLLITRNYYTAKHTKGEPLGTFARMTAAELLFLKVR